MALATVLTARIISLVRISLRLRLWPLVAGVGAGRARFKLTITRVATNDRGETGDGSVSPEEALSGTYNPTGQSRGCTVPG